MAPSTGRNMLSDEEIHDLLLALGRGQGEGFTEADARIIVDWATETRAMAVMLSLILEGRVYLRVKAGGPIFVDAMAVARANAHKE